MAFRGAFLSRHMRSSGFSGRSPGGLTWFSPVLPIRVSRRLIVYSGAGCRNS